MHVGRLGRLFPFLWPFSHDHQVPLGHQTGSTTELVFRHRHAFVTDPKPLPDALTSSRRPPQILFNDNLNAPNDALLQSLEPDGDYTAAGLDPGRIRTVPQRIQRAKDPNAYQQARLRSIISQESTSLEWEEKEIPSPDFSDRLTVLELAKLTGNAYAQPGSKDWYSIDDRWNRSTPFGWEHEDNGFRGNIFVANDNSTVVISIKGTSLYGQGPTAGKDKLNDNRLFRYGAFFHAALGLTPSIAVVVLTFRGLGLFLPSVTVSMADGRVVNRVLNGLFKMMNYSITSGLYVTTL
jgi:hypothetical protein